MGRVRSRGACAWIWGYGGGKVAVRSHITPACMGFWMCVCRRGNALRDAEPNVRRDAGDFVVVDTAGSTFVWEITIRVRGYIID